MVIFDYGHTLVSEPGHNERRGTETLMRCAVKNPQSLTPQQVRDAADALRDRTIAPARATGLELHEHQFMRLLYETLQLEFSISWSELERVFCDGCSPGEKTNNVEEMLDFLQKIGIRSGVVSNILFSGAALKARIDRLLPRNEFEFIIASSEYGVRKPNPLIFQLALAKSGLPPEDVWFCGDNIKKDVDGSAAAGMFPVWCDDLQPSDHSDNEPGETPRCGHLRITDWMELIAILEELSC